MDHDILVSDLLQWGVWAGHHGRFEPCDTMSFYVDMFRGLRGQGVGVERVIKRHIDSCQWCRFQHASYCVSHSAAAASQSGK